MVLPLQGQLLRGESCRYCSSPEESSKYHISYDSSKIELVSFFVQEELSIYFCSKGHFWIVGNDNSESSKDEPPKPETPFEGSPINVANYRVGSQPTPSIKVDDIIQEYRIGSQPTAFIKVDDIIQKYRFGSGYSIGRYMIASAYNLGSQPTPANIVNNIIQKYRFGSQTNTKDITATENANKDFTTETEVH